MSWIWGGGDDEDDDDNEDNMNTNTFDEMDDDDDDEEMDSNYVKGRVLPNFDPKPLQLGAKALKDIDSSQNAEEVLRLAWEQEKTKQKESRLRAQQLESENLRMKQQMMKQQHEHEQRQREMDQKNWKYRLDEEMKRKENLQRTAIEEKKKAQDKWLQQQKQLNEENLQRQKQIEEEIEKTKRSSMDYQAKLDRETNRLKVKEEMEGKIKMERQNEDIHLRSQKNAANEERKTKLEIRKEELLAYREFFSGLKELITDEEKLKLIGKTVIGITAGVVATRKGINLVAKQVENHLGKPSLVRETSRWSWKDMIPNRKWLRERITRGGNLAESVMQQQEKNKNNNNESLSGIILEKSVLNKMKFITRSIIKTKENNAPFRHLLIHGPPGTGKTLFARTLSRESGLDYAVVTGADFSQLGSGAVKELHKLFDWSETSRKGSIIFIDEADAFLRKGREDDAMSESMRNALSAFLYRTGTETHKFMVVLATNVPSALDKAVLDRIDDMVEFPLPKVNERKALLQHYFEVYITQKKAHTTQGKSKKAKPIEVVGFDGADGVFGHGVWDQLAEKSDGFSGRQIAKYMIQIQHTVYGSHSVELTPFLMLQVLETFVKSKAFGFEDDNKNQFKHL